MIAKFGVVRNFAHKLDEQIHFGRGIEKMRVCLELCLCCLGVLSNPTDIRFDAVTVPVIDDLPRCRREFVFPRSVLLFFRVHGCCSFFGVYSGHCDWLSK